MSPRRARRAGASDIRVKVRRRNLDREFTIMPNALVRGDDGSPYADLDPTARLFLMCGLTCQDDWETTLGDIEEWIGGLGRNRNEAIRRALREQGFLSMQQVRGPGGGFEWEFMFTMEPLPPHERDQLQEKKPRAGSDDDDADGDGDQAQPDPTMPRIPGHGGDHEETAGGTMPRFSGPRGSGPRSPGPGERGGIPIYEKNQEGKEPPSSPPPNQPPPSMEGGAGEDPFQNPDADLNAFVVWFFDRRPDWRRSLIANALVELTHDRRCKRSLHAAALVLRELVEDEPHGRTSSPRRAAHDGVWWAVLRPARPAPEQGGRRERCESHPWEAKGSCTSCKGDAKARDDDDEGAPLRQDALRQLVLGQQLQRVLARNVDAGVPAG